MGSNPYTTRVVSDEAHGYRILVKRYGLESRVGPRLQRGLPGSGAMFEGAYVGENPAELMQTAKKLEDYLNKYEETRFKRKRRR